VLGAPNNRSSYFVAKLTSDSPACGNKMPAGHTLAASDVSCIRRWLAESLTAETTADAPAKVAP